MAHSRKKKARETDFPQTLQEAIKYFSDLDTCTTFMAQVRWPEGVTCPYCQSKAVSYLSSRRIWKCMAKECHKQFSVKVGSVMEDSPIKLDKWLSAVWMITNAKNGISSCEIARALDITQKSAWFLLHRIRLAMQTGTFEKMGGTVEADETFIGGLSRYMHKDRRERRITGPGGCGKAIVMGLLERHGEDGSKVRTQVIPNREGETIQNVVRSHVEPGCDLMTDAHKSYRQLADEYFHQFVDHAEEYVRGNVHTNGMENFWTLLKRSIKGTYVSVEPYHLFRYLDEQSFRFNERKDNDAERFVKTMRQSAGKRLTFDELIGKKTGH